ncbi:hypothetical protein H7992_20705 [Sporosarcina sp. resist]|uniref:hypothetical protein n=1 Tax=Sporosarcina sp. resist TaxID=2762563 RepID=UPI00164EB6F0|nr:hypothetical protein [Sporosarcina sp. resist]QNK87569.1 hypothetical protein H7992_20705 [Sporosarcina sp. resist]
MGIEKRSLTFNNVLTYETEQKKENWQEAIFMLEEFTLNKDVYKNGPVFFSFVQNLGDETSGKFTYYLPISSPVVLVEDSDFTFQENLSIGSALVLRQADEKMDFAAAHEEVKAYANTQQIELETTYYCVLLDVYGDIIIDLYVPIKGQGDA